MTVTINDLLQRLKGVKRSGNGYIACCPAHDDKNASLSITEGEAGRILLHCHASCSTENIAGALGFAMRDLMGEEESKPQYSGAVEVARYRYGQYEKVRKSDKSFYWVPKLNGADPGLYNATILDTSDYVFVVEGEKDVETLKKCGLPAVCSAFGAGNGNKWRREYNALFKSKRVYICPDNDDIGYQFAALERDNITSTAASVQALDLLAVYPQLQTHGDISDIYEALGREATLDLLKRAQKMPPPGRTESGGMSNCSDNQHNNYTMQSANNQPLFAEFIPFEHSEPLSAFPLDALPDATREFVYYAAETVQAPLEMVGSCVLGALEIACKGRYPVKLPNGHIERACFYIAPIAPPSERKSGVTDIITRPHIDYEIEYNQDHGGEISQNRSELKLLQGRIANAEQQAIKAKKSDERLIAEHELQELNNELAEFEAVEPLRLFGADVTPEKLAAMLKAQGCTFALVSAEGGGLFENIGRYSDKGGLEIYLNGYSGDRVCVDRKNSESIVIDRPTLNIIAPCQPSVVADLFSDKQKTGRGLLSRIMFIKCQSRVGTRRATGKPLDERVQTNYRNLCHSMLAATNKGELIYDEGGFDVYCAFFDEIEPQLTPDIGELSFMGDWAGKLPGNMTRLAGLIHCIAAFEKGSNPLDTQINADEARAAVELARFYLAHAKTVYSEQAEPENVTNARYLWERIKSIKSLQIAKRELIRKTHGKQGFDINESLTFLVERGYIRVEFTQTGGRPAETIIINPETQNIVTKVTKASDNFTYGTLVTKVTIPANVPNTKAAADFDGFTEIPADDLSDLPPEWLTPSKPEQQWDDQLALDDNF